MTKEIENETYDLEERLIDFAVRIIRIDFNFYDQH